MAKIPFSIEHREKIESGEYKVETRDGRTARIICWDRKDNNYPIIALFEEYGKECLLSYTQNGQHVIGKSNVSDLFLVTPEPELSEFEESIFKLLRQYKECDIPLTPENIKSDASMLWMDFEKHFFNLYGREGEGDSALRSFYYKGLADGKAEALKDLPRWKRDDSIEAEQHITVGKNGERFHYKGHSLLISDLTKLPGFKEGE